MGSYAFFATLLCWQVTFGITNNGLHATSFTGLVVVIYLFGRSIRNSILRKRYQASDFEAKRLEMIEKIMKEPKGVEITDYEERIRRNLLFTSFIAFIFTCLNLQVSSSSRFFGGVSFTNLKPEMIYFLLLLIISYEFIHYFWHLHNNFKHWRVRLTGMTHPEFRGDGSGTLGEENTPADYVGKDENSNFYVWMFESKRGRDSVIASMNDTSDSLKKLVDKFDIEGLSDKSTSINELTNQARQLTQMSERLAKSVENIRLDASLLRFDQCFRLLVSSQNIRWFLLDLILPFLFSGVSIFLLVASLFFGWKSTLFNFL